MIRPDMKLGIFIIFFLISTASFAKEDVSSSAILAKLQYQLDLQEDQINNVTPIIEKYAVAFHDLQTSIDDGTINPSAVDTQWQGLEDQETQDLSQYLKPYQLGEWRRLQPTLYRRAVNSDDTGGDDQYTNLPRSNPSEY
jgi:hypothetical protein